MKNIAYGTYRDGQILLDAPIPAIDESRVQVIFLKEEMKRNNLMDIFNVLGKWEDERDTETILSEMRRSRTFNSDIHL